MLDGTPPPAPKQKRVLKSFASFKDVPRLRGRGNISPSSKYLLIQAWFKKCGNICYDCGMPMRHIRRHLRHPPPDKATIDHIIARCLGGTNTKSNLRIVCSACNSLKACIESAKIVERRKMYRERAIRAARTRMGNNVKEKQLEDSADLLDQASMAALKTYKKALSKGVSRSVALKRARHRWRQWEAEQRLAA